MSTASANLVPLIAPLPLKRLSADLWPFFISLPPSHTLFAHLTHLEITCASDSPTPGIWSQLPPAQTHTPLVPRPRLHPHLFPPSAELPVPRRARFVQPVVTFFLCAGSGQDPRFVLNFIASADPEGFMRCSTSLLVFDVW
ncbi:hypothetical protein B0H17DRAFT_1337741 [Mycena rosella]|uniref:Uncharacterized protein n=1 Tax=Mycena rosella TaxID=1033263 RepID=A0AAD7CQN5_MYCRO|nr:hypothetical protein B0H17DRAFT_1337741 [Mycena rosella]